MIFQKTLKRGAMLCGFLAAICASNAAQAVPVLLPGWSGVSIDVTIDPGYNPINRITVFTITTTSDGYGRYSTGVAGFNEFTARIPPGPAGVGVSGFAAGVLSGMPGDPVGPVIDHLVIFGAFSAPQLTMDFTALFPHIAESTIINDLLTTPGSVALPTADYLAFMGDAKADGLYGVNGQAIKAVAFTTGKVIGSGNVLITLPAAVPEPVTLAMFGAGLAGVAALRRRKRKLA